MKPFPPALRRLIRGAAVALAPLLAAPLAAHAGNIDYAVPYAGSGNLSVFDPVAGTGGWVGSIVEAPPTIEGDLPDLVSVVLFTLDPNTLALTGTFEFTTAADLSSTLYGSVSGSTFDADFLNTGGQLQLDYTILGGTGIFDAADGYGLAFLTYDPAGNFDNTTESGLLAFSAPEPATLALLAAGVLGMGFVRRKGQRLN